MDKPLKGLGILLRPNAALKPSTCEKAVWDSD